MKLCPICQLNWIENDQNSCIICDKTNTNNKHNGSIGGGGIKHPTAYFQEYFTFTNEKGYHRGKNGFQAFNSKGENIGIVFMTDVHKTPAYGHCELCMYPAYYNQYGEWHRITSHGGRIKWSKLCEILKSRTEYKVFID
ncbi:MAG: hypothetical protein IKA20_04210 [Clostridia bacterium]|nr:hypothetical protein [Clostridia bacterium]